MKLLHRSCLAIAVMVFSACSKHSYTPTEPIPQTPTLSPVAGDYNVRIFFLCKTNQDLPAKASERVTVVQNGPAFTAALPRNGVLTGQLSPTLTADVTYTFTTNDAGSACSCAITASHGAGEMTNTELRSLTFSEGTATHCQFGNLSLLFERIK